MGVVALLRSDAHMAAAVLWIALLRSALMAAGVLRIALQNGPSDRD